MTTEHRRLDTLFRRTREALALPRGGKRAAAAFDQLREAVDRHLAQEDNLYYPPIWALRPEYKTVLQALVSSHDGFRHRLAEISDHLMHGEVRLAMAALDAFVRDFGRHEAREERLLEQIERTLR